MHSACAEFTEHSHFLDEIAVDQHDALFHEQVRPLRDEHPFPRRH